MKHWYHSLRHLVLAILITSMQGTEAARVAFRRPLSNEAWAHVGRVIGGTDASQGEYPFMAFLMVDDGSLTAFCGGTIIARQWILTAGHCVVDEASEVGNALAANLTAQRHKAPALQRMKKGGKARGAFTAVKASKVKVGVGNVYNAQTRKYAVSKVYMHPDLNLDYFDNDVALLKLKKKLSFGAAVQPIHIDTDAVADGLTVTGVGWGKTTLASQTTAAALQQVDLRIGDEALCKRIRPEFDSNNGDYICVTTPDGRDTCSGDSGGPLLRRCSDDQGLTGTAGSGPWLQLGITSYGDNAERDSDTVCASASGAGFYTHVATYLPFISKTTGIKTKDLAASCKGTKIDFVGSNGANGSSGALPSVAFSALAIAMVVEVLFNL
ncbi:hypothetical protein GGI23_000539 [Coemansia sp. RSA 2559]|nr:hypothetical protein GGI23_000539 [Coemansia sp. RSA 2559]KAJ2867714.1 hypothetical protein GGI22_000997 [Coemansia erecta]